MLTHHQQELNGDMMFQGLSLAKYQVGKRSLVNGLGSGMDHDESYNSERLRLSRIEKVEIDISRLMEKNNGQIFIVKQEKNGSAYFREAGFRLNEYSQGEWSSH